MLNYSKAMDSDEKNEWENEIKIEDDRMNKHNVWDPVLIEEIPQDTKPLASTLVLKKKSSLKRRVRLNANGFKQIEGVHCDKDDIAAPITNEVTIRVLIVITLVLRFHAGILYVKGTFLQGEFEKNEKDRRVKIP